uniref:Uncharacterized protein n=1 Tax=Arundo donax TaxID=35708 RepID=A0A0A9C0Y9_ARUDO
MDARAVLVPTSLSRASPRV